MTQTSMNINNRNIQNFFIITNIYEHDDLPDAREIHYDEMMQVVYVYGWKK